MGAASNVVRLPTAAKRRVRQPAKLWLHPEARALRAASPMLNPPAKDEYPAPSPELALLLAALSVITDEGQRTKIAATLTAMALRSPDCSSVRQALACSVQLSSWKVEP